MSFSYAEARDAVDATTKSAIVTNLWQGAYGPQASAPQDFKLILRADGEVQYNTALGLVVILYDWAHGAQFVIGDDSQPDFR